VPEVTVLTDQVADNPEAPDFPPRWSRARYNILPLVVASPLSAGDGHRLLHAVPTEEPLPGCAYTAKEYSPTELHELVLERDPPPQYVLCPLLLSSEHFWIIKGPESLTERHSKLPERLVDHVPRKFPSSIVQRK